MNLIEKEIEINGKKYQYLDNDIGEKAIVFIHGLGSNKNVMPKIFNSFLNDYRCIFIDLPAHNKLPHYNFNSLEDFGEYIYDFIRGIHLKNFSIIGFSFGGLVTIKLQKILQDNKIKAKAVVWASPLRKDFLTLRSKMFFRLIDSVNKKFYQKLPSNIYFKLIVALLGIKVTDEELKSFRYFENNLLDKFYELIPDKFIDTKGQEILYIFGTKDPLIIDRAQRKTLLEGDYQKKFQITKAGHYMTKVGKKLAHDLIKDFIK